MTDSAFGVDHGEISKMGLGGFLKPKPAQAWKSPGGPAPSFMQPRQPMNSDQMKTKLGQGMQQRSGGRLTPLGGRLQSNRFNSQRNAQNARARPSQQWPVAKSDPFGISKMHALPPGTSRAARGVKMKFIPKREKTHTAGTDAKGRRVETWDNTRHASRFLNAKNVRYQHTANESPVDDILGVRSLKRTKSGGGLTREGKMVAIPAAGAAVGGLAYADHKDTQKYKQKQVSKALAPIHLAGSRNEQKPRKPNLKTVGVGSVRAADAATGGVTTIAWREGMKQARTP